MNSCYILLIKSIFLKKHNLTIFLLALLFSLFSTQYAFASKKEDTSSLNPKEKAAFERLAKAWVKIRDEYVEVPDYEKVIDGAIRGMLSPLDPHSAYMTQEEFKRFIDGARGSFIGIGIQITMDTTGATAGLVRIISPIDDSPADIAGLQTDDHIIAVDKEAVRGLTLDEVIGRLKGKADQKVVVTILRKEQKPFDVTIIRAKIKVKSVFSRNEKNIGYIRISSFTEQTYKGFISSIHNLNKDLNGNMKGLIIDLRNNPGGLLDQAVKVSKTVLNGGEIVSTRPRDKTKTERIFDNDGDLLNNKPIIVLINRGSASASEIVAGAIQDKSRGLILGSKSFGKGSVQTIIPLDKFGTADQKTGNGALRLTTARYYTPSGKSIQNQGITPDLQYKINIKGQEQHDRLGEAGLRNTLSNDNSPEKKIINTQIKELTCQTDKDCLLEEALKLIRNSEKYNKELGFAGKNNLTLHTKPL